MLLLTPSMSKPKRIQGAWVTDDEVNKITDHLRMQRPPQYDDEIVAQPVQLNGKGGVVMDFDGGGDDDMFRDAVRVVVDSRKASTSPYSANSASAMAVPLVSWKRWKSRVSSARLTALALVMSSSLAWLTSVVATMMPVMRRTNLASHGRSVASTHP